jgi:hypothetical protein
MAASLVSSRGPVWSCHVGTVRVKQWHTGRLEKSARDLPNKADCTVLFIGVTNRGLASGQFDLSQIGQVEASTQTFGQRCQPIGICGLYRQLSLGAASSRKPIVSRHSDGIVCSMLGPRPQGRSRFVRCYRRASFDSLRFTPALARQCDAVGIVHQTIEDGVGQRGITDDLVPAIDRHLAGDDQ